MPSLKQSLNETLPWTERLLDDGDSIVTFIETRESFQKIKTISRLRDLLKTFLLAQQIEIVIARLYPKELPAGHYFVKKPSGDIFYNKRTQPFEPCTDYEYQKVEPFKES